MSTERFAHGLAIVAGVAVVLATAGWVRHSNYWSGGLDLGIFDQGIWLLSRGREPFVTVVGHNLWADHFSPALLLFVPLYLVAASPLWLIAGQAVAVAATILPMRAFARDVGVRPAVATALTALHAPLLTAAMFDFHPWTAAAPFIGWAVLAAHRGDRRLLTVSALAIFALRGDLLWVVAAVLPVADPGVRRRLLVVAGAGLALAVAVPPLFGETGIWDVYYGHLGESAFDAALHPWRVVAALFTADALATLVIVLLPVGFVVLGRPRWALSVAVAAVPLMISQYENMHVPWFHYYAATAPLAVAGALDALGSGTAIPHPRVLLVMGGIAALAFASPLAPNAPEHHRLWTVLQRDDDVDFDRAISAIGGDEAVAATNRAIPHLTHRVDIWSWPSPFVDVEPVGLGAKPDEEAAARIDVVVVDAEERPSAVARGLRPAAVDADGLYIGRR